MVVVELLIVLSPKKLNRGYIAIEFSGMQDAYHVGVSTVAWATHGSSPAKMSELPANAITAQLTREHETLNKPLDWAQLNEL